jgi:hypothetical protein
MLDYKEEYKKLLRVLNEIYDIIQNTPEQDIDGNQREEAVRLDEAINKIDTICGDALAEKR